MSAFAVPSELKTVDYSIFEYRMKPTLDFGRNYSQEGQM